jgi:amino acid adenylation domain-containing protein
MRDGGDDHEAARQFEAETPSVSVYDLFQTQARSTPNAIAVIWDERAYTYVQLDEAVSDLARRLAAAGVAPADRVALYIPRSLDMLVACLAVWKIGATYVPLDLASPVARVQMALDQCRPAAILYASALRRLPNLATPAGRIDVSRPAQEDNACVKTASMEPGAAYIIFTSGSSGAPKGVIVDHAALCSLLRSVRDTIGFSASDVFAATSSLSFDISALELFLPLIAGGTAYLLDEGVTRDAVRLCEALDARRATVVQGTPSMWRALLQTRWRGQHVQAIAGGEVLDPDLARGLSMRVATVWNAYGPTEATIWATMHRVTRQDFEAAAIPIGVPLSNTVTHVVDSFGAPAAADTPGEILIGGQGLARGYLDRPDLDADRFQSYPGLGERLYRTGDIGYRRTDGALVFLRRADAQIKFRGVRIEPGEIEARLLATPGVSQAAVAVRVDDQDRKSLAAFLVAQCVADAPTDAELRAHLGDWLPESMIPSVFVWMKTLPLTTSGKVDRSALSALAPAPRSPTTSVERSARLAETIAEMWGQVLGREPLGLDEDFFGAGGDSLAALNAVFLVASSVERDLNVTGLIEHPTPSSFSAYLAATAAATERDRPVVDVTLESVAR